MGKPVRRDFWDWVIVLGDGLTAILGGVFVLAAIIASFPVIIAQTVSDLIIGSKDNDA